MRKYIGILLVYVIVHSSEGDSLRSYEGQSQNVIESLLLSDGKTGTVVTPKVAQEFIDSHPIVKVSDLLKEQAKTDLNTKAKTPEQRIDAIIKYLDLDK